MRLSWAQAIAGGLTLAVVAGLILLPSRLLGPDRPVQVAVPQAPEALPSVQAAPPRAVRQLHRTTAGPHAPALSTRAHAAPAPRATHVTQPRTVVRVSPARKLATVHRSAVISKLAPTAPLARARVLAAVHVQRQSSKRAASTAKTIAALAASLSKK